MVKRYMLTILLMFTLPGARAQVTCFVQTQMDRNSVYAQQPFRVTFTVLTATWYTSPLEFDNLQIPNAFIMPFDRTVPGMFTINGKQYAGLQFYYIVFPYKAGRYTLPAINITAETPAVGNYKGQKVNIKTRPLSYFVKEVPKSFGAESWFVAKDVSINENWDKTLRHLKVGDIINRTISISAKGTLPQFIPDLKTDSLNWAGVYPKQATLADTRDEYDANGNRTQTITYLLEKEGDFTIPTVSIEWFNPNSGHIYKRNTQVARIHVAANPNLGILKTLQDSLKANQTIQATINIKKVTYMIGGIPWYYFALYSLAALCLCYFIIRAFISFYKYFRNKYNAYLTSEEYWFSKFTGSSMGLPALLKNLYAWWDRFPVRDKSSSIQKDAKSWNAEDIDHQLASYYQQEYAEGNSNAKADASFKKNIKRYRKILKNAAQSTINRAISVNQTDWIN